MKRVIICGYHGFSNSGDETLLKVMIDGLKSVCPDVRITVLSLKPAKTAKENGVEAVFRYDLLKIGKLMKTADLFLFGGGSLLQDATSARSLYYYLAILQIALNNHVKVMLYGNGIGPLYRDRSRAATAKVLNQVQLITVRDEGSAVLLKEIGVTVPKIIVTADPVFSLHLEVRSAADLLKEAGIPEGGKYAVIAIRKWKTLSTRFEEELAAFCESLHREQGIVPLFIPMQYREDTEAAIKVVNRISTPCCILERNLTVDETISLIRSAEFVVAMRLHALIYGAVSHTPAIALSYDTKVREFMRTTRQDSCMEAEHIDKDRLLAMVKNMDAQRDALCSTVARLREKAMENTACAAEFLK